MNKYLIMFAAVTAFTSALAFAGDTDEVDPKKCYKVCMREFKDKDSCNYMCYDGPKPDWNTPKVPAKPAPVASAPKTD